MKVFKSEFGHSYKTYSFGYCTYAIREPHDQLADIYASGFLPYTGAPDIKDTLYMARSARVNLSTFSPNSENRRVLRKFDSTFTRTVTPLQNFDYKNKGFLKFCLTYFEERHGKDVMPRKRLLTILESKFITDVVSYAAQSGDAVGYAFEVNDVQMGHYWFSFYDPAYIKQSLGLWIMLDCMLVAQKAKRKHYYVGTVYGEKGLYKTNLDSLEYWDGNEWVQDVKKLRLRARTDGKRTFDTLDEWKENHELF